MNIQKKVIGNLEKCYSVAPLHYQGADHFLVAAEKVNKCLLFDLQGNEVDTVWTEPGGVMTMVQIPGTDGQFLATHQFYSPNDSKNAKIVLVTPIKKGEWKVETLVDLPYVHRFDILQKNGVNHLIACTLKSGHEYKDDWSMPGMVYGAVLPKDLTAFHEGNQLKLTVLKDSMLKNHGYVRAGLGEEISAVISCQSGVYEFTPPANEAENWKICQLISDAASDGVLIDLDGDGELELGVVAPFHGEEISIYKKQEGVFKKVYTYPRPAKFLHAILGGIICGKPRLVVGHRQEERDLLSFTWNPNTKDYEVETIDTNCGPANVITYSLDGVDILIATNREIDEIAMYTLTS